MDLFGLLDTLRAAMFVGIDQQDRSHLAYGLNKSVDLQALRCICLAWLTHAVLLSAD